MNYETHGAEKLGRCVYMNLPNYSNRKADYPKNH